jgi:FixJ family two-component response regulator
MQLAESPGNLVIIDDDPHVLNALRFAFEIEGYDVETYTAGEEALAAPFIGAACIIVDENLPGLSGVETASLLRGRGLEIPIILITTCPSRELRQRAADVRAEIIEKPLVSDALARRVKQAMKGAPVSLNAR